MDSEEAEYKKLRWRSRRGMLELDLLLIPFFDRQYGNLSADERRTFAKLLEQEDPDLLAWFSRTARPADERLAAMVDLVLDKARPAP